MWNLANPTRFLSIADRVIPWLAVATFLTFGVGVTRVYFGVHYPTDVLAGWSFGASWAIICATFAALVDRGEHRWFPARPSRADRRPVD